MATVISLGGSMINGKGKPDLAFVKKFAAAVSKLKGKIAIVTGGGKVAREYASAAAKLGASHFSADAIAVRATRMNAHLLVAALGSKCYPRVPEDFEEASFALNGTDYKYVVMGGTIPGITTDTDAVLLGEAVGATRLINLSNVDGIYDSDPNKSRKAKKHGRLTHAQLVAIAQESDKRKPGTHFVFDLVACKLAMRSGMQLHFVGGKNLADLPKAAQGKGHRGTVVSLK